MPCEMEFGCRKGIWSSVASSSALVSCPAASPSCAIPQDVEPCYHTPLASQTAPKAADCYGMATPSAVIWPEWFTPSLRLSGTGSCTPLTRKDSREGLWASATPCHFSTSRRPLIANFNLTATARFPIDLRRANQQVRAPYFIAMLACATKLDHTPPLAGLRCSHFPVARRPTTQALPRISAIGSSYLFCIAKTKVICWVRNEKEDFSEQEGLTEAGFRFSMSGVLSYAHSLGSSPCLRSRMPACSRLYRSAISFGPLACLLFFTTSCLRALLAFFFTSSVNCLLYHFSFPLVRWQLLRLSS